VDIFVLSESELILGVLILELVEFHINFGVGGAQAVADACSSKI
jgi:hypothetical protein